MIDPQNLSLTLEYIWNLIFLNPVTCPIIWILASLKVTFAPSILCILIAINGFVIGRMRTKVVKDWRSETVLISGGSSGLGLELAYMLKSKGATVIVVDLQPITDFKFYQCDISDVQQVNDVCKQIKTEFKVSMLVNNAGIVNGKLFIDTALDDFKRTVSVNVFGSVYLTQQFVQSFIDAKRGHILFVSSVMGMTGASYSTDYCASKFAITGFSESLRQEISNSTLFPGLIETGMFNGVNHRYQWLTPHLQTKIVSAKMLEMLEGKSSEVMIPFYAKFIPLFKMLPVELNDLLHLIMGANDDLANIKGRAIVS